MTVARRQFAVFAVVVSLAVGSFESPAQAETAAEKKAREVAAARKLQAEATDDESILKAIQTLDAQVKAADAQSQGTRQSVKAAQAAANTATSRLATAEAAMKKLRGALVKRAIQEYKRPQQFVVSQMTTGDDINLLTRRKALLNHVTAVDADVLDELRVTREDLMRQRAAADRARAVRAARQKQLEAQLRQLVKDRASRGKLSASLEARIKEIQAEAAALAGDDANVRAILGSGSKAPSGSTGAVSKGGLVWPVRGRLTSGYGRRWGRLHAGIDIAAPKGTPIKAAKAGTVVFAGRMSGYGNVVIIDHGGGFSTLYGHQSRLGTRRGARVSQGQVIGYVGSTGHSTGNHLHLETRVNGVARNPRNYL